MKISLLRALFDDLIQNSNTYVELRRRTIELENQVELLTEIIAEMSERIDNVSSLVERHENIVNDVFESSILDVNITGSSGPDDKTKLN